VWATWSGSSLVVEEMREKQIQIPYKKTDWDLLPARKRSRQLYRSREWFLTISIPTSRSDVPGVRQDCTDPDSCVFTVSRISFSTRNIKGTNYVHRTLILLVAIIFLDSDVFCHTKTEDPGLHGN
jgi:hypothetical protein